MNSIDILESQVAELETKVFGKPKPQTFDYDLSKTVVDGLLHINTLISSALTGREAIASTMNRLPELNKCLDPNYEDNILSTEAKMEYVFAMQPEITEIANQLKDLAKMIPILDSNAIQNVPTFTPKLEKLSAVHLDLKQENDVLAVDINEAVRKYNDIIVSITHTFSLMESLVTDVEISRLPKKNID